MVICGYTLVSPMSTSIVAPALGIIGLNLNATNDFLLFLILSIFVGAYAFGPFILGPLSEVYGRVIVLQVANLFYLVFNTACGFAQTPTQMIIFRLLAGLGGRCVDNFEPPDYAR
jgi:MFS family permease